jgi:hypothetical protein
MKKLKKEKEIPVEDSAPILAMARGYHAKFYL